MLRKILKVLRDFGRAIGDHRHGRTRCRFENIIKIDAAPEFIWQTIWCSGHIDGVMGVDYQIKPLNDAPDHYQASLTVNETCHRRTFRVCEDRDSKAVSANYVSQETESPTAIHPHNFALVLEKSGDSTLLVHVEEVSLCQFWDRIFYPLGTRWVLQLLKTRCEARPREMQQPDTSFAILGIASAAVAFFASWYVSGFSWAVLLIISLMVHEYGHVLAMRIIGMPTSGLYLVPFMGGAILAHSKFRSLLDDAFCALMGPVFSLLPSLLFFAAYCLTGHAVLGASAALFALVNLINLLPMPPFDGGNIARAIFSSLTRLDLRIAGWALLAAGFAVSIYQGLLLFGIGIALIALLLSDLRIDAPEHAPMSKSGMLLIMSAMIFTGAVYCAILYITLKDSGVTQLITVN